MEVMKVMQVMRVMKEGRHLPFPRAVYLVTSITFLTSITCITSAAFATDKPFASPEVIQHAPATGAGGLLQVTFSLALVLGAVFAAAWVVRRLRGVGRLGANAIQVVADAPLGTKERAVLIQIGEQQLLLGVAPGQVNLLHVLPQPLNGGPLPDPPPATGGGNENIGTSASTPSAAVAAGNENHGMSSSFPPPVAGGGQGGGRVDFAAILRRSLGLK